MATYNSIDTFNKMISKNPEKRFSKNYNFIFGNDYINNKEFKNTVDNFINNNENIYNNIYQKVMSADMGITEDSARVYSNMLNFIAEKENISTQDIQSRMLTLAGNEKSKLLNSFNVNKEVFDNLGLDSSIWTINNNSPSITKTKEELIQESLDRQKKIYQNFVNKTNSNKRMSNAKTFEEKAEILKERAKNISKQSTDQYIRVKNEGHQRTTQLNVKQSYIDDLQNELNKLDSKIVNLSSQNPNHPDLINLKKQREGLYDNLKHAQYTKYSNSTMHKLALNPPREGAPMFEGNIVPSEIADTDTYEKILNTKAEQIRNEMNTSNNSVDIQDSKNYRKLKKGEGTYRRKSKGPQPVEPRISDLDDDTLANLTDEEIMEWAQNSDDYNEAIELRKNAREKLGMDTVPEIETTGKNTELETPLNNNLNNRTSNTNTNTSTIDNTEETIEEKIKRLTEEERQRFERESQADFDKSMEEIETEFNQEAERIENEFGPAKYDLDDTSLHLDSPDIKTRKQRLENTGKRLSNNKGPNETKKRKLSGKKLKVKGGNLKQAAANTFVNIATDTVRETISKNADELKNFGKHPNMFEFDEFADLTDADIDFYYDNLFGMDVKTKQQMKKSWIEKRKLAKTARESAKKRKIIDNFDDYMDNFFSYNGYSSVEGQARFNPDPEVGWDETDFKNPDSYNRHRIDFEVDDDGNLKFKRYDEMETVEIEQNRSRKTKGNVADDDIFGWMKKHKIGLGEAINVLSTVSAYKDARKQGHSVGSSVVRAAGSFVMGEMLGFWGSMGWELAKGIPKAAIKGAEVLYKENRKMNAAANQHGLGGDFQDTQQLATMRQSGMEMAKMAQYNLQQTLMGNEATYLHR